MEKWICPSMEYKFDDMLERNMAHGALREEFGLEKNKYKKYLII